jgi:hypothetical protein
VVGEWTNQMRIETNEEIAKRGMARIGDVNDMAKERSDDHSGGSNFFCFFSRCDCSCPQLHPNRADAILRRG